MNGPRPLVVDLDGTLLRGDLSAESYLAFLRRHPLRLLAPVLWLRRGRAAMKSRLAAEAQVDIANLPYDEDVLAVIDAARREGRPVILATGSDGALARQVAEHLGRFDRVLASDGRNNLKGAAKAARLIELYGHRGFDYIGNSRADLPVWRVAATAFVANPEPGVLRGIRCLDMAWELVSTQPALPGALWRALHPWRWLVNCLLFLPLAAGGLLAAASPATGPVAAFCSFSLCASAGYLLRDLVDLADHRATAVTHPGPLADGTLPIWAAAGMVLLCGTGGLLPAALLLPPHFLAALCAYLALSVAHSLGGRRLPGVRGPMLAALLLLRPLAGIYLIAA